MNAAVASEAPLGVLMLQTTFARPVGDIGHPASLAFPVIYETVDGATVDRVVRRDAVGLQTAFIDAGRRLVARGACAITSSCGFLVLHQQAIARALPVPVALSSLVQLPWIEALLPEGSRCAVVTATAESLGPEHLDCAGGRADTPVAGMPPDGAFARAILQQQAPLDAPAIQAELESVVENLLAREGRIGALLLECTNLPPYRAALRARFGLPVYDIRTLACWLWQGACHRGY